MTVRRFGGAVCPFVIALALAAPAVGQQTKEAKSFDAIFGRVIDQERKTYQDGRSQSSGDPAIDQIVATEFLVLEDRYRGSALLLYEDENPNAVPNAYWTPLSLRPPGRLTSRIEAITGRKSVGSMVFGKRLIAEELKAAPGFRQGHRSYILHAIMAHELGHMLQFVNKSTLSPAQRELHADFLAGWSAGIEKRRGGDFDETQLFGSFYMKGDELWYDIDHHGTKAQRLRAFLEGFETEDDDVASVYRKAATFVQNLDPEFGLNGELHSRKLGLYYIERPGPQVPTIVWRATRFPDPGSPADRAGFEMGDVILELNGKTMRDMTYLELIADPNYQVGDTAASLRNRAAEALSGRIPVKVGDVKTLQVEQGEIEIP